MRARKLRRAARFGPVLIFMRAQSLHMQQSDALHMQRSLPK
jgi:hypothetical protein